MVERSVQEASCSVYYDAKCLRRTAAFVCFAFSTVLAVAVAGNCSEWVHALDSHSQADLAQGRQRAVEPELVVEPGPELASGAEFVLPWADGLLWPARLILFHEKFVVSGVCFFGLGCVLLFGFCSCLGGDEFVVVAAVVVVVVVLRVILQVEQGAD